MKKPDWKKRLTHLSMAFVMAAAAGGAVGSAYLHRDALFDWNWASPVGTFSEKKDEELRRLALLYLEERLAKPGEVCVDQWVGKDDRYIYMSAGCAHFEEKLGRVVTHGDINFHPVRFRYDGDEIEGLEQPLRGEDFKNSLRRLFPREAALLLAVRMNPEIFQSEGLAKIRAQQASH